VGVDGGQWVVVSGLLVSGQGYFLFFERLRKVLVFSMFFDVGELFQNINRAFFEVFQFEKACFYGFSR
jgi:hypothetical protein